MEDGAVSAVERFVPEMKGAVRNEHIHRYRFASQWLRGARVLDVATGEGYGARILAEAAREVVGADVDSGTVVAAAARYRSDNLRFVREEITSLSFPAACFEAVVCFETIEHVARPEWALDELRRVLKPDGLLIISTPDKACYPPGNPFHVHEMTEKEFVSALGARFGRVELFRQRSVAGSMIAPADGAGGRDFGCWSDGAGEPLELSGAHYLIAVCGKAEAPDARFGLHDSPKEAERIWYVADQLYPATKAEADFLRARLDRWRRGFPGRLLLACLRVLRRCKLIDVKGRPI